MEIRELQLLDAAEACETGDSFLLEVDLVLLPEGSRGGKAAWNYCLTGLVTKGYHDAF